jgi:hypothetical protein
MMLSIYIAMYRTYAKSWSYCKIWQFKVIRYLCFLGFSGDEAIIAELFPSSRLSPPGEGPSRQRGPYGKPEVDGHS